MACEDFPACGHGPAPLGDGGGCPDALGRYKCVLCGKTMPRKHASAICRQCHSRRARLDSGDMTGQDAEAFV